MSTNAGERDQGSGYDADVPAIAARWEANLRYFYKPTLDILRGLSIGYNTDPDFIANFQKIYDDLPAFLQDADDRAFAGGR